MDSEALRARWLVVIDKIRSIREDRARKYGQMEALNSELYYIDDQLGGIE